MAGEERYREHNKLRVGVGVGGGGGGFRHIWKKKLIVKQHSLC